MATETEQDEAIELVRIYITDLDTNNPVLSDTIVRRILTATGWSARRAAADALDMIATSEALISKVIRSQDLETDGAKLADSLRKHGDRLRAQADAEDDAAADPVFDVMDTLPGRSRPEHTNFVTGL